MTDPRVPTVRRGTRGDPDAGENPEAARPLGAARSRPFPLGLSGPLPSKGHGAGGAGDRVNVAVYAPELDEVEMYVQAPGGSWRHVLLPDCSDGVHHGTVTGVPVGSRYGFRGVRVPAGEGPEMSAPAGIEASGFPASGFDPETSQLLLDPYGRYIDERTASGAVLYSSVRMGSAFDWGHDHGTAGHTPWRNTVIYEAHVKGLTMLHPEIPAELRGSYAGMAHPAMIGYLLDLGITAVELLPVHFHIDEPHLRTRGLKNYWGYNTLGYFAPQVSYASPAAQAAGPQAVQDELKGMIKLLHAAGIEVILDVVYNHTAEGPAQLPALCWRGLGDGTYYRHEDGRYADSTGCGNTLDFSEMRVVQMTLDSLRYWVEEFHIDGFRFDLAVSLARNAANEFRALHPFLIAAATDKALAGIKLIAEPWDLGGGGWQTGRFPAGWVDWNDHYRDAVRDFWLSDQAALAAGETGGTLAPLADSLAGSAALFAASGRSQLASVNFVTAHDGFTLADLVSYNHKENTANGEDNRDGPDHNRSWNHGVEGSTNDDGILSARARTARNMMATLLLSLGVPMITAGDEIAHSQRGNNNPYCQDNETAWLDWTLDAPARQMLAATKRLIRVRRDFLAHQPSGYPSRGESSYLHWYTADGTPMTQERWHNPAERVLQMLMGSPAGLLDGLVVFNAGGAPTSVTLPDLTDDDGVARSFELRFTTAEDHSARQSERAIAGGTCRVEANSISIFRC
ncbi:glycogen debranching protein GlgX [Arthrobacter sp. H14-L1]|uniref:glycogen debranching protein GlgX n=1 Tax=Arthrobacter sp. H14-L1 TaxID=2996697 RepID=UPI00226F2652|nr:glycogen debranching protein GlgX [Arthrobacter sp. H14-L1]MCY0905651.1 glycogen debranching protein GlgX [Arthrobacter sp. H14-L1]